MKKRVIGVVVLVVLLAASAYAQSISLNLLNTIFYGAPEEVQAAIDEGADVNAKTQYGKDQTAGGATLLMLAAENNSNPDVITTLIKAGAGIEARDGIGVTPLMYAARNPNPEVVRVLLSAGADAEAKDDSGRTAYEYAQDNEKLNRTDALLKLINAYLKVTDRKQARPRITKNLDALDPIMVGVWLLQGSSEDQGKTWQDSGLLTMAYWIYADHALLNGIGMLMAFDQISLATLEGQKGCVVAPSNKMKWWFLSKPDRRHLLIQKFNGANIETNRWKFLYQQQ